MLVFRFVFDTIVFRLSTSFKKRIGSFYRKIKTTHSYLAPVYYVLWLTLYLCEKKMTSVNFKPFGKTYL